MNINEKTIKEMTNEVNIDEVLNKFSNHELFKLSIKIINSNNKLYANLFFNDIFFNEIPDDKFIKYLKYIDEVLIIEGKSFFYEFSKLFKNNYSSIPHNTITKFIAVSYSFELVSLILLFNESNIPPVDSIYSFINYLNKLNLKLTESAYSHIIINDYGTFANKINIINKIMLRRFVYDKK